MFTSKKLSEKLSENAQKVKVEKLPKDVSNIVNQYLDDSQNICESYKKGLAIVQDLCKLLKVPYVHNYRYQYELTQLYYSKSGRIYLMITDDCPICTSCIHQHFLTIYLTPTGTSLYLKPSPEVLKFLNNYIKEQ
jgi:hypothetical protein